MSSELNVSELLNLRTGYDPENSAQEWVLRNFIHVRIEIATRDHSLPSSMLLQNPSRSSRTGPKEALNEASNMKAKRQA